MQVSAGEGKRHVSSKETMHKKRTGDLPVPFAEIDTLESITTGFRAQMFDLGNDEISGGVATGSGFGSDFITLEWGDKKAIVRGIDLLRAWVATFDPAEAERFPEGLS